MNTQTVSLNISKAKAVGQIVRIGQADSEGTTIEAHVHDGATPANLSEATATFCMRLPDGTHFVEDGNCTISGNVVTYVVDEEHCAVVEGYTDEAYFRIDKGGSTYSTARFRVKVFRAASSGASVPESYSSEVEDLIDELDDAIETATDAASVANAAAANADATADGVESRVQEMAQDAAETATADAEQRIQDAIDAMGDISELAVPLMSPNIRGGAKLEEHGGLVLRDEKLGIGSLVQESDGYARGGLAEVTAKGHAEQASTTGKNLISTEIGAYLSGSTGEPSGYSIIQSSAMISYVAEVSPNATYTISAKGGNRIIIGIVDSLNPATCLRAVVNAPNAGTVDQTFATQEDEHYVMAYLTNDVSTAPVEWVQLELGSEATEYEPYSGGLPSPRPDWEQPIEVVRGKNLLNMGGYLVANNNDLSEPTASRYISSSDGTYTFHRDAGAYGFDVPLNHLDAGTYVFSYDAVDNGIDVYLIKYDDGFEVGTDKRSSNRPRVYAETPITVAESGTYGLCFYSPSIDGKTITRPHVEHGSTPQPYVPYGHVGMEVRDPDTDELISCTALPLPQRGWVGSLPDGTADVLTLDGAGKVEWELADAETTTAATDGITGTVGTDVLSTTGQIADGATVLYKLATPVMEELGYIDPPSIDGECQISIPELDELGVRYFVDDSAGTLARQWYERAQSEYEDRLSTLESIVAELV